MGSDPRLGIPYPEGNVANDVPKDIKAVVDKIGPIMAVDMQGTLAQRPAAGVRGRFYNATDDSLFRDDGSQWVRLTSGAWKSFSATPLRLQNGGGTTVSTVTFQWSGTPIARYRLMPGNRVEYLINGLGHLSGTPTNAFVGIEWTAPTSMEANIDFVGQGDIFNDTARVVAQAGIGVIAAYPTGGYLAGSYLGDMVGNNRTAYQTYAATGWNAGRWPIDNFDRAVRIQGFYSTP
jgi:hypothetical protein